MIRITFLYIPMKHFFPYTLMLHFKTYLTMQFNMSKVSSIKILKVGLMFLLSTNLLIALLCTIYYSPCFLVLVLISLMENLKIMWVTIVYLPTSIEKGMHK